MMTGAMSARMMIGLLATQLAYATAEATCKDIKTIYQENACCADTAEHPVDTGSFAIGKPADPPIPGVLQGSAKAHVLLGMAPDYPPYTDWSGTPLELGGFNIEFGYLMEPICGVKVDFILAPWSGCWTARHWRPS